jgi:hypothetical protein
MDANVDKATYEETSKDAGSLDYYVVNIEFNWEVTTAISFNTTSVKLYIATSEDDITYTEYEEYEPFERYFQYYNLLVVAEQDPEEGQRPKLTRLELHAAPSAASQMMPAVENTSTTPPATPTAGELYYIDGNGAGGWAGHNDTFVYIVDSTTPTYQYIPPREGQRFWDKTNNYTRIYDGSKMDNPYCLQGRRPMGIDEMIDISTGGLVTVVSVTTVAGDFDDSVDEFFIKAIIYTGTQPPAAGDQCIIQINDSVAGWTTVWTGAVLGPGVYGIFRVTLIKCPTANTACLAIDTSGPATRTAGLAANWMENMTEIRVQMQGDANSRGTAAIYNDRNI